MKRILKNKNSEILQKALKYSKGKKDRDEIRKILIKEQGGYCAYTEIFCNDADYTVHIEHFKAKSNFPELRDDYYNWFATSGIWNQKKKDKKYLKILKDEEILTPIDSDLEDRVIYNADFHIFYAQQDDIKADNIIKFLNLNDFDLVNDRKNYIERRKLDMKDFNVTIGELLKNRKDKLKFSRAMKACIPNFNDKS
ncbi:MAG: hypothetical protein ACPG19_03780 [Saprospiraceae bacterium]